MRNVSVLYENPESQCCGTEPSPTLNVLQDNDEALPLITRGQTPLRPSVAGARLSLSPLRFRSNLPDIFGGKP